MRKAILIFSLAVLSICASAQKMMKPSVMVVPSDNWCTTRGFVIKTSTGEYPDYKRAIANDPDLINVISKINIIMSDRGFPLENLETALKNVNSDRAERTLYTGNDGSEIQSTLLDDIYRAAAADIVLQLTWNVNKSGPKHSITFNLQAIDSYTNKQVAGAEGTGRASFSSNVPILLEEAVVGHMDDFCDRLMRHFKETRELGREVALDFYLDQGTDINFETETDGYTLAETITRLISKNAVNHSMSRGPSTETMLQFKSVRIPVADDSGLPMDAYAFGRSLVRQLSKDSPNLSAKVIAKGLGKAIIIIGEE